MRVAVLTGSFASRDPELDSLNVELDQESAILALAAAVIQRGGVVSVPLDVRVAMLLALTALPYSQPHGAENRRFDAQAEVVETQFPDTAARRLLGPYVMRNALTYRDRNGEPVAMEAFRQSSDEEGGLFARASVQGPTPQFLNNVSALVVIHPDESMITLLDDIEHLGPRNVAVIPVPDRPVRLPGRLRDSDPTRRLLADLGDRRESDPIPYGLVMERLVDEWGERPEPHSEPSPV